ncbi:MAG: hypothetical protein AAB701_01705 [Patescibacteria group bacterium]
MQHKTSQSGYITLLTVLIVSAVGVAIGSSLLLLGLGSSRSSLSLQQSKQAAALADACVEEALQQLRFSTSYSGTATLSFGTSSCTYLVTVLSGENRNIESTGTVGAVVRRVEVDVSQLTPKIVISSWQEVASF